MRDGAAPSEGGGERRAPVSPAVRRLVGRVPALLIIGGLAFGMAAPPGCTAAPFFAAAPPAAAPLSSLRTTALTALAATLGEIWTVVYRGAAPSRGAAVTEIVLVLAVSLLALAIHRVVRAGGSPEAVREAAAAQRAVLPTPPARLAGFAVAARYRGARAASGTGGDLYAVQDTPHGVRLIVGDVRGKGLPAVASAMTVLGAFREAADQETSLEAVAGRLERALERERERGGEGPDRSEDFATALLAELPAGEPSVLRVLNRGHPAPLLLAPDGGLRELLPAEPGLPLGMSAVGSRPGRPDETFFPAGALLLCFTDGVSAARDLFGRSYHPPGRLRGGRFPGPDVLLDTLIEDVTRHTGGEPADDLALLAVQRPMGE
ncbi:PP2C family protein-serine/threonine phosphatase [Streptomyces kronopolitis]|uniref:PP2C family protein-serine/threonine phosphatase n=1 Tax=Streptomyces kronopolitis TaxID=1612435 RepID=UPI003439A5A8